MFWRGSLGKFAVLASLLVALGSTTVHAEVLDELTVFPERADAVVRITFGVRIQYLRHAMVGDDVVEIYFQVLTLGESAVTEYRRIAPTPTFPGVEVTYPLQPLLQLRKIIVRFSSPVTFRVRPGGNRSIDLIIPDAARDVVRRPTPGQGIPSSETEPHFAVRLESFLTPDEMGRAKPVPGEFSDYVVFTSQTVRDGRTEHEVFLGYFATAVAAAEARGRLLGRFPSAEVVDLAQRRQASLEAAAREATAPGGAAPPAAPAAVEPSVAVAPAPPAPVPAKPAEAVAMPETAPPASIAEVEGRAAALMARARAALDAGDNAVATDRLNQVLMLPPNRQSQEAQELVGLARERSGEVAKARAEYELYLKLFPEGEGATRVRERLAGLAEPTARTVTPAERAPVQTVTGTISQYYYGGRSKVDTVFNTPTTVDRTTFTSTDQSSLVTNVDLTLRSRTASSDNRLVVRDTNSISFLSDRSGYNRLNAAYYDYRGRQNPVTARLGRQTGLSGGLPNRFDGGIVGYGVAPKWRVNAVGGLPVEYPSIDSDRQFWGANLEFENLLDAWSGDVFFIDQRVDGILDRRAVGMETRYFDKNGSLFTLIDYDTSYKVWNIAMFQGTWQFAGGTTLNALYDRRRAPILTTTNAIFGQGTTSISTLLQTLTEDQIRQQARDVTATATQALVGFTTPVSAKWQVGADVRLTNVGALPSVVLNGITIPAQPATGNIYSYDIQAIGTNLYSSRDTHVFSGTYLTGPLYQGYLLSYNNLTLIQGKWTVEPSIRYYTQNDSAGLELDRWTPGIRLTYRVLETVALESELTWERTRTVGPNSRDDTDRGFFYLGYRWDL